MRPALNRQQSVQLLSDNRNEVGGGVNFCIIPVSIAALIVASLYVPGQEDDVCSPKEGTKPIIHPVTFLYIAGGLQMANFVLFFFAVLLAVFMENKLPLTSIGALSIPLSLFYTIWAIIGLVIYMNQLNSNCIDQPVAKMMLAWSIIEISLIILTCCLLCCLIACFGLLTGVVMGAQRLGNIDVDDDNDDADPLLVNL